MSKKVVEPERLQMAMWGRDTCWISKAKRAQAHVQARVPKPNTEKHARTRIYPRTHIQKYVILIAFPRQEWFCERAS